MVVVYVGVRMCWLFFVVFFPISCFKFAFLEKALMGCMLLNISVKRTTVCLVFPLHLAALGCVLPGSDSWRQQSFRYHLDTANISSRKRKNDIKVFHYKNK